MTYHRPRNVDLDSTPWKRTNRISERARPSLFRGSCRAIWPPDRIALGLDLKMTRGKTAPRPAASPSTKTRGSSSCFSDIPFAMRSNFAPFCGHFPFKNNSLPLARIPWMRLRPMNGPKRLRLCERSRQRLFSLPINSKLRSVSGDIRLATTARFFGDQTDHNLLRQGHCTLGGQLPPIYAGDPNLHRGLSLPRAPEKLLFAGGSS